MDPNVEKIYKTNFFNSVWHDLPNSLLLGDPLALHSFESEWICSLLVSTFTVELPLSVRSLLSRFLARMVWNYWWLG